ncbi:peptidylprolyl isomerase [Mycobacterium paraterrae]|uniref:peptidylprolyl isomerase n=1 Tax=Mycobacterium paraterrae TaxID=577492 RepID=UPI003D9CA402
MTIKVTRIAALLGITAVALTVTSCSHHKSGQAAATTPSSAAAAATSTLPPVPPVTGPKLPPFFPGPSVGANCQYPRTTEPAGKQAAPPPNGKVSTEPATIGLTFVTDRGRIPLQLANNESPCTVSSFVSLAQQAYFDNTECHRLTTARALSVLQCGDPKGDGTGGPGYQFANEFPTIQYPPGEPALKVPVVYPRGTLAMANAGPGTNGSQFFMVYRDSLLPPTYTIFGTITPAGLAVIDKIASGGVAGGGDDGKPANEVAITSARLD